MDLQKIKAVIFDLDGTLLDTLADVGTGANFALCQFGYPTYPLESYRQMIGHGVKKLFRAALPEGSTEADVEKVNRVYQGYYPENCTVHTSYFPGTLDFIEKIQKKGLRMAVISNKTETTANKVMAHYFPHTDWAFVWGNNGQRPLKPSREAGFLACQVLGLQPEEIVYVGDGDTDMEFASAMGFVAAGVTWGNRTAEQLKSAGADFLADSFDELYDKIFAE